MEKRITTIVLALFIFAVSCKNKPKEEIKQTEKYAYYGDSISAEGFVYANEVINKLASNDSIEIKIKGKVNEVCQKKGCWMTVALNDTTEMRVRFKDYGFFMPFDIANDTVIFNGWMYKDSVSVEELRHYEKDAGKSQATIDSIISPELNYLFEANGVLLKK